MEVAVTSLDRRTLIVDLAECHRLPAISTPDYFGAVALLERWLLQHYQPIEDEWPPPPSLRSQPRTVGILETADGRMIVETRIDGINPNRSRPTYWEVDPRAAEGWYELAKVVRRAPRRDEAPGTVCETVHVVDADTATVPSRAIAMAHEIVKEGLPVSVRSVCDRAHLDRSNLRKQHPEIVRAIKAMGTPKKRPPRGGRDRRTGDIYAIDEPED